MASSLYSKLEADIRSHVLTNLPHDPLVTAELEAMDTWSLLSTYCNWRHRFVPVRPRRILQSNQLNASLKNLEPKYRLGLEALVEKIRNGDDVTAHLSTRILVGYKTPTTGNFHQNREDLDLLLNDWTVHHLHLGTKMTSKGFVARTKMLLFGVFMGDAAFLIDLYDHQSWTRKTIATTLIDNWPGTELVREHPTIVGVEQERNDDDRALLRNNGIVTPFIPHKGKFYSVGLGGGVTSAGTSIFATRHSRFILQELKRLDEVLSIDPDYIARGLRQNGIVVPTKIELQFLFMTNERYGILETNSKAIFPFPLP